MDSTDEMYERAIRLLAPGRLEVSAEQVTEALKLVEEASQRGHGRSKALLAFSYQSGWGHLEQNFAQTAGLLHVAAFELNDPVAILHLQHTYLPHVRRSPRPDEVQRALAEVQAEAADASRQWDVFTRYTLARCNQTAPGHRPSDEEALRTARSLADTGFAPGLFMVASAYRFGHGVEKDMAEATKWMRLVAAQGFQPAVSALEHLLRTQ